ncbi:MAG: HTH-type transcriptional activator IlvY [Desulfobacter sp.]|nr:MAG: HTH-type transcriptional activator IlvY [Desulfobacter sp.]
MDIRTLELFRHLSNTLHFTRTSQACNISPSALSRVVQRIEAEVGEQLFYRDNRSVELTYAGFAFKKYAEDVLGRWDRLQGELSEEEVLQGELSVYCSVTAAYSILPEIITRYRAVHPGVQIRLQTGDPARAIGRLMNRDADVVIAALPGKLQKGLSFLTMAESPLVFISARQYPEAVIRVGDGGMDWENTPMILAETGLSRERMDLWFAQNGVVPNIYSRVAGHEAILALVNLGCGVGLVPKLVLDKSPLAKEMRMLSGMPELPPYEIGLCTREKSLDNPRIRALWEIAARAGKS